MLNQLLEFTGRSHLVVLHFPIALVVTAALVETVRLSYIRLSRRSIRDHFCPSNAAAIMLAFGCIATGVTSVTGLIFGFGESARVDLHRILGIIAAVFVIATTASLVIAIKRSSFNSSLAYVCLLCISAIAVSATGHFGGELTHGSGFLTEPLRRIIEKPKPSTPQALNISAESFEAFNTTILPIFENSCIKCHGHKKQKGDIRLDSLAFVLDDDAFIVDREDPQASELLYRLTLDPTDEDAMPPFEDGDPLSNEQVEAINSWLQSIASD